MKKCLYVTLISCLFLAQACEKKPNSTVHKTDNSLIIPETGFEFELVQRNAIEIPSEKGGVICRIDDITRGQTVLTILQDSTIVLEKSMRNGRSAPFTISGINYQISCLDMVNLLLGDDHCFMRIDKIKK